MFAKFILSKECIFRIDTKCSKYKNKKTNNPIWKFSKKFKKSIHQRKYMNDQQSQDKMLNIINH